MKPRLYRKPSYKRIPSIYYIDRQTKLLKKERIPAEQWLKWLYHDPFGNLALETVIKRKSFSRIYGRFMKSPRSSLKIKSFIKIFNIDIDRFEKELKDYSSFNDFFIRKIKHEYRKIDPDPFTVVSPADGKILAYDKLDKGLHFIAKGHDFSLPEFLNNEKLAAEYYNGSMLIIRLTPADYHRFHFPVEGIPGKSHKIKGKYYSVSPISIQKKIRTYCQNKREYTLIKSAQFGNIIMAEIGATLVGSIRQTFIPEKPHQKGDEKGYFEFGGSSVILLFKENSLIIDQDILHNTQLSYETTIRFGERIGTAIKNKEQDILHTPPNH
jgi:phosphatidylserine decarboxylase